MMILNIETAGHWLVVAKGGKISWSLKCVPFILTMSFVDRVDEIIRQNEHSTKNFFLLNYQSSTCVAPLPSAEDTNFY